MTSHPDDEATLQRHLTADDQTRDGHDAVTMWVPEPDHPTRPHVCDDWCREACAGLWGRAWSA